jgi:hypothetical protein
MMGSKHCVMDSDAAASVLFEACGNFEQVVQLFSRPPAVLKKKILHSLTQSKNPAVGWVLFFIR